MHICVADWRKKRRPTLWFWPDKLARASELHKVCWSRWDYIFSCFFFLFFDCVSDIIDVFFLALVVSVTFCLCLFVLDRTHFVPSACLGLGLCLTSINLWFCTIFFVFFLFVSLVLWHFRCYLLVAFCCCVSCCVVSVVLSPSLDLFGSIVVHC